MTEQNLSSKPRLAFVITRAHHGGAQAHVLTLMGHFRHRFDVHLATGEEGPITEAAKTWGVPVRVIRHLRPELSVRNIASDIRAGGEIWRWLGQIQPHIVHTHSSKAGGIGRVAALLRQTPRVFTAHGWGFTDGVPRSQRWVMLPAEWLAARVTNAVITVSDADHTLARRYRVRPRQLVTIHNGIGRDAPLTSVASAGPVRLVCVARFSPQKNQATLIRALSGIQDDWRLSLVGDGPLEDDVRRLTAELGLADRVEFLGARDDVNSILAQSHIFVLPSNWEGFPLTILEAMRAGLPVVASDVGGVGEAVVEGVTGYLVDRRDEEMLRDRLSGLIREPVLRVSLGDKGREVFLDGFTDVVMFDALQAVYDEFVP